MSEEIFIKEEEPPKPAKKKRVLTEKQREGLAKGRAKMAEKRRLKKEMEAKRKELAALDTKAVKDSQKETKKARGKKKEVLQEQKTQQEEYLAKKKRGDRSSSKFNELKTGAIKHIKSTKEMDEFDKIMKGVSKEMERDPELLYSYLREHGDRLMGRAKQNAYPKKPIKEEEVEKKPSIKLHIDEL